MIAILAWFLLVLAAAGCVYTLASAVAVSRLVARPDPPAVTSEPVTLLKPLHGAEPRLADNLATFLAQDWPASIELVAGVADPRDPAVAALDALPQGPWRAIRLVADPTRHGANAKVGNLANMMTVATIENGGHDLLVLSDSDMVVAPDYIARVAAALAEPGVGAVTCAYRGRGDAGFWSVMAAAGVSYGFLPQVAFARMIGDRRACMGSTIALRRATLDAIGGFAAFADVLADDQAIGAAVRARGLTIAMPPMILTHASTERSLAELWRHELRWAATVRGLIPTGQYLGIAVTQPLAPALLAIAFLPRAGLFATLAALATRLILTLAVDRAASARTAPLWRLPLRDCLTTAVFIASFAVRSVDWRGQALRMEADGRVSSAPEPR